jgi:FtsH-binding integral membrane protein
MKAFWIVLEFAVVALFWIYGDGHQYGIGNNLPDWFKLTLVLSGWVVLIDAIRTIRGHRSYMRPVLKWIGWGLVAAGVVAAACWTYDFIPLKGFVVIGVVGVLIGVFYIVSELRMIRESNDRQP